MRLIVEGFKSIVRAELEVKPLTILVGPPDTGKSNLLEALGLLSFLAYGGSVEDYFRYSTLSAVFSLLPVSPSRVRVFLDGLAEVFLEQKPDLQGVVASAFIGGGEAFRVEYSFDGSLLVWPSQPGSFVFSTLTPLLNVRFYRFHTSRAGQRPGLGSLGFVLRMLAEASPELYRGLTSTVLLPPRGLNLSNIISQNSEARLFVQSILEDYGYRGIVTIRVPWPHGPVVEAPHAVLRESTYIPLDLLSDGLKVYTAVALALTQKLPKDLEKHVGWTPAIIALEEPEIHLYPYKIVDMARLIASVVRGDKGVHVVLSTHNMHMVSTLLSKTPRDRVAVYYTGRSRETGETLFKELKGDTLEELVDEGPGALPAIEEAESTVES